MSLSANRFSASINSKLAWPLLVIFCLVIALFFLTLEYRTRSLVEQKLSSRAVELADTFAVATEINTSNVNFVRVVNSIGAYEDVKVLFLLDDLEKTIVASSKNRYSGTAIAELEDSTLKVQLLNAVEQMQNVFDQDAADHLWFTYKLQSISEDRRRLRRMTLLMEVDVSSSEAYVRSVNVYFFIALMALLTVIALTFYIVVRRYILTPVTRLMASIEQTRKLNRPVVSMYQSDDEMGVLSKVYNELIVDSFNKQRALTAEREKSEAALLAKSRFLAMMTHELRTPLNGVIGMSDQLDKLVEAPKQRKYLSVIQTSANQLLSIINDTLDFSKIEADKLELDIQPLDLMAMMKDITSMFEPRVEQSKVAMSLNFPQQKLPLVDGDRVRISQVVINLLGNAVKFTEKGHIEVSLQVMPVSADELDVVVKVTDSGIGMSQPQIDRLFEEFSQADSSTTRKFGGTGLGLWITKKLVEKMCGRIEVQSSLGQGTTFSVHLPLPVSQMASSTTTSSKVEDEQPQSLEGCRILLVDDTEINRMVVAAILEPLSATVIQAENGQQAVDLYCEEYFDLILMDCLMPVMDGFDASRKIRIWEKQSENARKVPIVALTANALEETRKQCVEAGMDEFLTKPVVPQKLLAVIGAQITESRTEQQTH